MSEHNTTDRSDSVLGAAYNPMEDTRRGIIAWFARNHVAANLLMMLIVGTGLISAMTIRTQVSPNLASQYVTVNIPFPGASPGEVETGVVLRVEEALRDIEGIARMTANARQSSGSVRLEVENGYDVELVVDEVNMAMDLIASLPSQSEAYSVSRSTKQIEAISVQITGDSLDERGMKALGIDIQNEILALPTVTRAIINGSRSYEISVELEEARLRQYGLTLNSVAQAIRLSSLDMGAGTIRTSAGNILLRTEGQAYDQYDFESLVLLTRNDGTRLTLGDIATVHDGFVEQEFFSLFNGKSSVGIDVIAVGDQNQINISRDVRDYIDRRQATLPDGIELRAFRDSTVYLSSILNIMLSNIMVGVLLVMIVLGLFLRVQLAFWVMLGMPIAFLGAFALMPSVGASVNMLSLFGFILVLGIVVDDAIIIGESVQTLAEQEGQTIDAVIRGAKKVAIPATFGVLTTVATFGPLLFVPGSFGVIPEAIGLVVILCLLFSIVESKLILPAHLASMKPLPERSNNPIHKMQNLLSLGLTRFRDDYYRRLLDRALAARYVTASIFLGMLILAVGFIAGPYIQIVTFPNMSNDYIMARVEMTEGSSAEQTVAVIEEISEKLIEMNNLTDEEGKFLGGVFAYTSGADGRVMAEVTSQPGIGAEAIANKWREGVGEISGTQTLEISGSMRSHGGTNDVGFSLAGTNPNELNGARELLEETLRGYAGVYEINSSGRGTIPEMNIQIKPTAESLGLTLNDLANQVRAAFYGVEAQRLQRGEEEVRVMVRYPKSERESLGNLETMYIRTDNGDEVPFSVVADIEERTSPASIFREWGARTISVGAALDRNETPPGTIVRDVLSGPFREQLAERFPTVRLDLGGASLQEQELIDHMIIMAAIGLFAIYALMAIPLRSYIQPIIIMGVIPFGIIGAMIGHLIVGIPFSALSLFGIVALAGVVVNDSIIMVDFVNKSVASSTPIVEAARRAGVARFRAILLTSLTTFFGLLPILLEDNTAAQMVIPMAVSLGFGILFATVITLILIPCLYVILDDWNLSRFSVGDSESKPVAVS